MKKLILKLHNYINNPENVWVVLWDFTWRTCLFLLILPFGIHLLSINSNIKEWLTSNGMQTFTKPGVTYKINDADIVLGLISIWMFIRWSIWFIIIVPIFLIFNYRINVWIFRSEHAKADTETSKDIDREV